MLSISYYSSSSAQGRYGRGRIRRGGKRTRVNKKNKKDDDSQNNKTVSRSAKRICTRKTSYVA